MMFEFYKRPGKISLLDDDPHFLEVIGMVLSDVWTIELFDQPRNLIRQIEMSQIALDQEMAAHKAILAQTRDGESAIAAMLKYWREDKGQRFGISTVLILDYAMPAITGTRLFEEFRHWPGLRILLTGQADEVVAITAFNKGLIHQYIPKQTHDLVGQLSQTLKVHGGRYTNNLSKLWMTGLTAKQLSLLETPPIANWLSEQLESRNFIEYVVIGAPFGILGITADGVPGWLQISDNDGSSSISEILVSIDTSGFSPEEIESVVDGRMAIDVELQTALYQNRPYTLSPLIKFPERPSFAIAYFPIDPIIASASVGSWSYFSQSYALRKISP